MTKEELFNLELPAWKEEIFRAVKEHWNSVAKPLDGLGKLETMLCTIGAVQESDQPKVSPRRLLILCADNGIVQEGVSQSGQEVTLAVARNMGQKKSSVCRMAQTAGVNTLPVDIGINSREEVPGVQMRKVRMGTCDFLEEPAMTEQEVLQAIETGISLVEESVAGGYRLLATGEMGIANTTTSTAVAAGILGLSPEEITGRGAGLSTEGLSRKISVIRKGLQKYGFLVTEEEQKSFEPEDPGIGSDNNIRRIPTGVPGETDHARMERAFEVLRCVGGLDIAGLCGVFIGGALYRVPIVIDGLISAAAALCAEHMVPGTCRFMLASHVGAEPGIRYILEDLGLSGVIQADLKLGEGTGAVMLFPLLDMALEVYKESNSFAQIGMAQYERLK